jgi:hypothetical protein
MGLTVTTTTANEGHDMYQPTRYEIAATTKDDAAKILIGYTARKSRMGLLLTMQAHGQRIIDRFNITDAEQVTFRASPLPYAFFGDRLAIGFTGRTQKDAKTAGELPYIAA